MHVPSKRTVPCIETFIPEYRSFALSCVGGWGLP